MRINCPTCVDESITREVTRGAEKTKKAAEKQITERMRQMQQRVKATKRKDQAEIEKLIAEMAASKKEVIAPPTK